MVNEATKTKTQNAIDSNMGDKTKGCNNSDVGWQSERVGRVEMHGLGYP